jgi:hypothetical protein
MQFRAAALPQVSAERPAQRPPPSDRDCPWDTARDRCLWHAGGTAGEHDVGANVTPTAPSSPRRGGRSSVTTASWARGRRARGSQGPEPYLHASPQSELGMIGAHSLRSLYAVLTVRASRTSGFPCRADPALASVINAKHAVVRWQPYTG